MSRPRFPEISFDTWKEAAVKTLRGRSYEDALTYDFGDGVRVEPLYGEPGVTPSPPGVFPYSRAVTAAGSETVCLPRHDVRGLSRGAQDVRADARSGVRSVWIRSSAGGELQTASQLRQLWGDAYAGPASPRPAIGWDAGGDALPAAALLTAALEGVPAPARLRLLGFCDPLAALARDGSTPRPLGALEAEALALVRAADPTRGDVPLLISGATYHGAGARPAQELAIVLAAGVHQLRRLADHGVPARDAARSIGFSLAVGRELFPEIAKLRALRSAWSRVLAAFGVNAGPAWLHAVASERTLTQRDPWVNLLRVTTQTFAAIAGGADAVTPSAFDEACRPPEELGRRMARNTPEILLRECALGDVLDPAGGSYWVETLTEELGRAAWTRFQAIERRGGLLSALESGELQGELDEARAEQRSAVAADRMPITGVTSFVDDGEVPLVASGDADDEARPPSPRTTGAPPLPPRTEWKGNEPFASLVAAARDGAGLAELAEGLRHAAGPARDGDIRVTPLTFSRDSESAESAPAPGAVT